MNNELKKKMEQFNYENNIELILKLMKVNNGYITSRILTDLGIGREYLRIMNNKNMIKRVGTGIYIDVNMKEDLFYTFNLELPNIIYSHMTALHLYGLSKITTFNKYDISIKKNYFNYKVKNHNVFYVDEKYFGLGLTNVETPKGNIVQSYDIERCICDIIHSRKRFNIEDIKYSVRKYLKRKDKNLDKLYMYAEKLKIREVVVEFITLVR